MIALWMRLALDEENELRLRLLADCDGRIAVSVLISSDSCPFWCGTVVGMENGFQDEPLLEW